MFLMGFLALLSFNWITPLAYAQEDLPTPKRISLNSLIIRNSVTPREIPENVKTALIRLQVEEARFLEFLIPRLLEIEQTFELSAQIEKLINQDWPNMISASAWPEARYLVQIRLQDWIDLYITTKGTYFTHRKDLSKDLEAVLVPTIFSGRGIGVQSLDHASLEEVKRFVMSEYSAREALVRQRIMREFGLKEGFDYDSESFLSLIATPNQLLAIRLLYDQKRFVDFVSTTSEKGAPNFNPVFLLALSKAIHDWSSPLRGEAQLAGDFEAFDKNLSLLNQIRFVRNVQAKITELKLKSLGPSPLDFELNSPTLVSWAECLEQLK